MRTLRKLLVDQPYTYISANWIDKGNFLKKQIGARIGFALLVPSIFLADAIDIILGLGALLSTAVARKEKIYRFANDHLKSSNLLADPYVLFLKTLYPEIEPRKTSLEFISESRYDFSKTLDQKAQSDFDSGKRVSSWLTFGLARLARLIIKIVDGVISILATTLSFVTFGYFGSLNNIAYTTLAAPGKITYRFLEDHFLKNPEINEAI